MTWRKLKKTALLIGCVVPGLGPLCGDELSKPKYRAGRLTDR